MPMPVHPVIVVPGITASQLHDEYPVSPEVIFSALLNKEYERLQLHPDNVRYELKEPSRVGAHAVFPIPYGELIEELRHNLRAREDEPVPVFPFPYDWRQPLDLVEQILETFVDEVIERTKLLRHYDRAGYGDDPYVNLVGHSMGGLVIAGYLQRRGRKSRVWKVATLGTPFRGSHEAPVKVVTGTGSLAEPEPSSREREAARLTPALYHLVPQYEGALEVDEGLPRDLYHVDTWQRGVVETIAEFVRMHGLRPGGKQQREESARSLLKSLLDIARRHRTRIEGFTLGTAGLDPSRWLCVVGVDAKTRVRLRIKRTPAGYGQFELRGEDRRNDWGDPEPAARVHTGDGTVPYLGALPSFLGVEHLVCVRPDDFGYWEVADQALLRVAGFHGILPKMNLAHRLIVAHFIGRARSGTWARPAPGVGKQLWSPPIRNLPLKE